MKVAVCFYGKSFSDKDPDKLNFNNSYEIIYGSQLKNIIEVNNADVFFHTWFYNDASTETLLNLYHPTKYIIEPLPEKDKYPKMWTYNLKCRWWSNKMVLDLKKQHEISNNFKYDAVFITRFDCVYFKKINMSDYDLNFFYVTDWILPHKLTGFNDCWFFSNSMWADTFSELYNDFDNIVSKTEESGHVIVKTFVDDRKIPYKHVFQQGGEYNLVRNCKIIKT